MTRKMKDSGIEWIGEIPEEWISAKLNTLMNVIGSGTTPKGKDEYYNGEIQWLNTGDLCDGYINSVKKTISELALKECSALKLYPENSVVIAMYGATIGKLGIITSELTTNQACCVMNCSNKLFYKFLFYYLYAGRDNLISLAYGAGQPNISQDTIKTLKICIPSIQDQYKIVSYLDNKCTKLDKTIEKQKQVIQKLKEYKQSIITESVTKGLNLNAKMKDSGVEWIGEIPEHWNICRIKNIADKITDGAHVSPETENGKYDFISVVNLGSNGLDFENCLKTSEESYIKMFDSGCQPEFNDVLISKDGTVGKSLVIDFKRDFAVASSFVIIKPLKIIDSYFLNYLLQSNCIQEQLNSYMKGTGLKRVSVTNNGRLIITIMDIEEQKEMVNYLDKKCIAIDKSISQKQKLIEKLTEYKKSLIYECVTGKREV